MANSRRPQVPREEQIRLINECRRSGMTDADWCRAHGIVPSTFYHWIMRCKAKDPDQIEPAHYGHSVEPRQKQEVVPVDIIPGETSFPGRPAVMQDWKITFHQ